MTCCRLTSTCSVRSVPFVQDVILRINKWACKTAVSGSAPTLTSLAPSCRTHFNRMTETLASTAPATADRPFHQPPFTPSIEVNAWRVEFPQEQIDQLRRRIEDTPAPRKTFENSKTVEPVGITLEWLQDAINQWKVFDWYAMLVLLCQAYLKEKSRRRNQYVSQPHGRARAQREQL